ncbi:NADH-quinone oxidoreductase subunit NuoF [Pseudofrankia asymbiotica]|uniref:NADH-quinone oxidoreductase subunit F n=1 Tax=Pseudofrankia asymbiotica TaxID=1834516 RepID=A0A1V2ICK8_9ACTN|nr:NADH-quinone oxidoreductase subunit NuoF [Pseudofrankia asymbiotica]ONH29928.1 NADH oxidoreductase (quinone) subunit F [Pseudofrankia asymbiotica]
MPVTPVLTARWKVPGIWTLDTFVDHGGYDSVRAAFDLGPDDIIKMVKDSGLRGRGGAGFPTGMKWSFIPQGDGKPHYLVINADEGEPGTCKDAPLMMIDPHSLIEGIIVASYAVRANRAFVYVRGELVHAARRLRNAVAEAYRAGYLGKDILGSGFDLDLVIHSGAGAYICGEETALLDSLEGRRGQPRLRPPFPATHGLYNSPTVVNNVETIASVPFIVNNGVEWFRSMGTEKSPGPKIYSLSGHVTRPGQYEAPMGTTLRELLEMAGGIRGGRALKAWTPGGSSTPMLTAEHLDVPLDFDGVVAAGSLLGTAALMIMDDTVDMLKVVRRLTQFYAHESCGKCTPCREGTTWMVQILSRMERGQGDPSDINTLTDACDNIFGRAFCALADGAVSPIVSGIKHFPEEFAAAAQPRPADPAQGSSNGVATGPAALAGAH